MLWNLKSYALEVEKLCFQASKHGFHSSETQRDSELKKIKTIR